MLFMYSQGKDQLILKEVQKISVQQKDNGAAIVDVGPDVMSTGGAEVLRWFPSEAEAKGTFIRICEILYSGSRLINLTTIKP